jgi:predicted transcriptional regulator
MKLVALRIDEEEKARLEQLAEERDVTLSRAFREGAALYLSELREKAHRARGGAATFLGVRRDNDGRPLNKSSKPTAGEHETIRRLRESAYGRAFKTIRMVWDEGGSSAVVLGALAQWLSLVGQIYVANGGEVGWDWFLRDYCAGYSSPDASAELRRVIRGALFDEPSVDVGAVLDSLGAGFLRLLDDAEGQELVRRQILPAWQVFERGLAT